MVTFKPQGRLGNYLFTAATAIAYVTKHGLKFSAPSETNDKFWNPTYFPHLIDPAYNKRNDVIVLREQTMFKCDRLPFEESWRDNNIRLEGYFQSEDYFKDYRTEVLQAFRLPWEPSPQHNHVSVHVRRGDYLKLTDKHPLVTVEWYEQAMSMFQGEQFMFFSDDVGWCKQTFGHRSDCFFFYGRTELEDLVKMSSCRHHINSASTFSWWGAWLNQAKDKMVVVPKQWHGPSHSNEYTENIIPKAWIRL